MGHITLESTCGKGMDAKVINSNYLIVDALSLCNITLGRPIINALEAIVSALYLILRYPFFLENKLVQYKETNISLKSAIKISLQ